MQIIRVTHGAQFSAVIVMGSRPELIRRIDNEDAMDRESLHYVGRERPLFILDKNLRTQNEVDSRADEEWARHCRAYLETIGDKPAQGSDR